VRTASAAYGIEDHSLVAVGFSNGANIASATLLRHPELLTGAVLLAAMVPYAEPPPVDLRGTLVIISNGDRDPLIKSEETQQLAGQLSERGAEVVELPHPGGHQIDARVLPQIRQLIADVAMPTQRSAE
jgi:phospholipase/carboxylesterase